MGIELQNTCLTVCGWSGSYNLWQGRLGWKTHWRAKLLEFKSKIIENNFLCVGENEANFNLDNNKIPIIAIWDQLSIEIAHMMKILE